MIIKNDNYQNKYTKNVICIVKNIDSPLEEKVIYYSYIYVYAV